MTALEIKPLTSDNWGELESLFGKQGACGGCWCMAWRLTQKDFNAGKGRGNKNAFRKIVDSGHSPGLLGFINKIPIAWLSFGPRSDFSYLERSRIFKPIDGCLVWSITCFFIHKDFRRQGFSVQMLDAAIEYGRKMGAELLEGYPFENKNKNLPTVFSWTGFAETFRKSGFTEAARRSKTRPIFRKQLTNFASESYPK